MDHQWVDDDDDSEGPSGTCALGSSEPVNDVIRYVMYHGTTSHNAESILAVGFRQSPRGTLGRGVYLSRDLRKASAYPRHHPTSDRVVLKVLVDVGKVIAINRQGHPLQMTWHDYGYDSAWVPPNCGMVKSGQEEDCVWDPGRIQILKIIKPGPVPPGNKHK